MTQRRLQGTSSAERAPDLPLRDDARQSSAVVAAAPVSRTRHALACGLFALLTAAAGCSADDTAPTDSAGGAAAQGMAELEAAGLFAPLGQAVIAETVTVGAATTFTLDPASGPRCLRGAPYRYSLRDGPSDELLVFLQGGGACWSEFCLAVNKAPLGVPEVDVLRADHPLNPYRDHDLVYLPYCDGSLFAGDRDHDDDGDGATDRYHRGLRNLAAALDGALARFPKPSRVVLAGSSGGAYGSLAALPLLRRLYPKVPIDVIEDSGPGLGRPGEPAFLAKLLTEFGAERLIPPSCAACQGAAHLTPLRRWQLQHLRGGADELGEVRVASIAALRDGILADVFLSIPGATFEAALRAETGALALEFPECYRRLLLPGRHHTALLGTPAAILGDDLSAVELPTQALGKLAGLVLGHLDDAPPGGPTVSVWLTAMRAADMAVWRDFAPAMGGPDGKGYPLPAPLTIGPATRPAKVRVPKAYDAVTPLPVVVLMGGQGFSAADAEDWLQLGKAADALGFVLVLADGVADGAGEPTWNATDTCCVDDKAKAPDDVGYLLALLDALAQQVHIHPGRVVLFGHSAGGFMAYRVACDHADRVAAVVSIAGSGHQDMALCKPSRPVRVLQVHAEDDAVMPIAGDAEAPGALAMTAFWGARAGCDATAWQEEAEKLDLLEDIPGVDAAVQAYGKGCAPGVDVRLWRLSGGGHQPMFRQNFRMLALQHALGD